MVSYIRGNDNFDSGDVGGAPILTSSTTSIPVGGYMLLSRQVASPWSSVFFTTHNASSSSFNAYDVLNGSWHAYNINYGTWIHCGNTYGYYDTLIQRIS